MSAASRLAGRRLQAAPLSPRSPLLLLLLLLLPCGCMVDGLAARLAEQDAPAIPPPAPQATIEAELSAQLAGAGAALRSPPPQSTLLGEGTVSASGKLSFALPGTTTFNNLLISLQKGERLHLVLVPPVERLETVHQQGRHIDMPQLQEWSGPVDEQITARLLLLHAAASADGGLGFAAVHPRLLRDSLRRLATPDGRPPEVVKWEAEFGRLFRLAEAEGAGPPLVDPVTLQLDDELLAAHPGPVPSEQLLAEAAATVRLERCFSPEQIRVVFVVQMQDGMKDGACREIDRWLWARDGEGKQMFFTGGVHESYAGLSGEGAAPVNQLLGSWVPNTVPMYDDGTHGDLAAGDGLWTIAFDLPRLAPPLRLGYKYTWGKQSMPWTDCEEWPGNSRLLELADNNDDGLVIRFDRFADEASNKDKANLNPAAKGSLSWDEDVDGDGIPETQEAPADRDGDCRADGWPPLGVAPLLGDLDEEEGCYR